MPTGRVHVAQTNFQSGQLDPQMFGRIETGIYQNGAEVLTNWRPLVTGGVVTRPGTDMLQELDDNYRLIQFQFNREQAYIFALTGPTIKVYRYPLGQYITEITGFPYALSDVNKIRWTHRGDTMLMFIDQHVTQKIVRNSDVSFTRSDFAFETSSDDEVYQPYFKFAPSDMTITATKSGAAPTAGATGCILNVSADYWTTQYVGLHVRIWSSTTTNWSYFEITGYTDAQNVLATHLSDQTLTNNTALDNWQEQVFSAVQGYPHCGTFHSQRLFLAGSSGLPTHIFGSKSGAFYNFDDGTALDDEAIGLPTASERVNAILHLQSGQNLQVFSDIGEGYLPESDTQPLIPSKIRYLHNSPYGISDRVRPIYVDTATLFVQENGASVREFRWADIEQKFHADAMSLVTNIVSGITDASAQYGIEDRPENYAYFVKDDGNLALYHAIQVENIRSWLPWETEGDYTSVVSINEDVFFTVKRNIAGVDKYFLERVNYDSTLDCSKKLTVGAETDTHSGFDYMIGQEVSMVSDHPGEAAIFYHGEDVVEPDGSVTIPAGEVDNLRVGLKYTCTIKTMPVNIEGDQGSMYAEWKRLASLNLILDSTLSVSVDGHRMLLRQAGDDFTDHPPRFTGKKRFNLLGWCTCAQAEVVVDQPLRATVLGLVSEIVA